MDEKRKKIKTWWWYHRFHVLIIVVVIAVVLYSFLPGLLAPKPDYTAAVITTERISEETRNALKDCLTGIADDRNGDGQVLLELNYYQADLSGETEGTVNYTEASRLDADLVGKVSSVFLLDNPEGFRYNTAVSVEQEILCDEIPPLKEISLPEGMVLTIRSDSDAVAFYETILNYR